MSNKYKNDGAAVKNAANEQQLNRAKEREELEVLNEVEDFKWILSDPRGRRFVWRLLAMSKVYSSSFTGNSETFFNEGRRSMGLEILKQIDEEFPELYILMMQESLIRRRMKNA